MLPVSFGPSEGSSLCDIGRAGCRRRGCRLHRAGQRPFDAADLVAESRQTREGSRGAASSRRTSSPSRARPARLSCGRRSTRSMSSARLRSLSASERLKLSSSEATAILQCLHVGLALAEVLLRPGERRLRWRRSNGHRPSAEPTSRGGQHGDGGDGAEAFRQGSPVLARRQSCCARRGTAFAASRGCGAARAACASLLALVTARASAALAAGSVNG